MKDQVFIGWSGSNDIAIQVKKHLETKNYRCTIGGNADNNSQFSSVGDTVIQQIKSCNQAIMIFCNRSDGQVSNNLFFELGYVLASYGQPKVHCVRRESERVVLPSDFDNSFVEPIKNSESDEKFVEGILEYFMNRQKMSINENKMMLINNRYKIHEYIQRHFSEQGSKCSDYELAQYILFYMQAGHMFGDTVTSREEMVKFKNAYHSYFSEELAIAVNMCITFYDMVLNIKSDENGDMYLERSDFRQFKDKYKEYYENVKEDGPGAFGEWAKVFILEQFTYAYSLYAMNPNISEEIRLKNFEHCREWAELAIYALDKLKSEPQIIDNNDHRGIISMIYAYIYRNLFLVYKYLGDEDTALKWLEKTKKERTALKNNFETGSIDTKLCENFQMEYYLTLIEYLAYADKLHLDEDDVDGYKEDIAAFIESSRKNADHNRYIDRIEKLLKNV